MIYRILFFSGFALFSTTVAYSTELTPSFAEDIGIKIEVTPLPDKYNASCSLVEATSPLLLPDYPEYRVLNVGVEMRSKEGVLISATNLTTVRIDHDESYMSSGCLPVNEKYSLRITWHYGLENEDVLCSKSLTIADLREWMNVVVE